MVATLVMSVAGCKSHTPASPSTPAGLSGTWRGTLTDPVAGTAPVTLTLTDLSVSTGFTSVRGTWEAAFPPSTRTTSGIVTGFKDAAATQWLIYLDPAGFPPCFQDPFPYSTHGQGFELKVTHSANRLVGMSTYRTCSEAFDGSVDLTR
jgi:hypothetical protein